MTLKRKLPAKFNHLLVDSTHSKDDLVDMRRLGQTKLMSSKASSATTSGIPQMTLFSYVHLRAPLPQDINPEIFGNGTKPEAYFLMRRSKDGFVSSTGMFKASFPWATKAEEDLERKYVKSHFDASLEETAGNLWVNPDDALSLSSDYHCKLWIEALVDDRKVNVDPRNKAVTPPPAYKPTENGAESLDPASSKAKAASVTASPARKIAQPRKSRGAKSAATAKDASSAPDALVSNGDVEDNSIETTTTTTTTTITKSENIVEGDSEDVADISDTVSSSAIKAEVVDGDSKATVEVETTTETKGDVVIESTHVKVELPSDVQASAESPEEMIAKAKEMVAEALKETSDSTSNKKRKIDDEHEVPDIKSLEIDSPPRSKRVRVINAITEEKFQKRALFGIGATVAIGGLAFFSNLL